MSRPVRSVAVIGAGMVGLATAFHLREHGVEVTVLDRTGVAAGSSWGNAGWLTPTFIAPLPEPAILRYGVRAVVSPRSAVYAPLAADPDLARFMAGFVRNSTHRRWEAGLRALLPLVHEALPAFEQLTARGVREPVRDADPLVAAFPRVGDAGGLIDELEHIAQLGGSVSYELVSGAAARALAPVVGDSMQAGVLVHGQRFINPVTYVAALADAGRSRGISIVEGSSATALADDAAGVTVTATGAGGGRYDAVVVATGAWLGGLARAYGVRRVVQAGRGYSFSVAVADPQRVPVYLPTARVAMTPLGERMRIAGMMELRRPDRALDPRRIAAIVDAVRPQVTGLDLDDRADEWVGSRPVTADGLPLIGATRSERVFVAGGHGMWGITLGPVTGALLAEQIVTGRRPDLLRPFDPLR